MMYPVIIAVLLVIITIIFFLLKNFLKTGKRHFLLTGLNDSGKSLIYSQLVHNKHIRTYTSMQENVHEMEYEGRKVSIVDIPGFHSIHKQFLDKYKDSSRGIIYVIDSVTAPKNIQDVANILYNILIDPIIVKNKPRILILCNKQDQTLAKSQNLIKTLLEKEITTLRNNELNQLERLDSKDVVINKLGDLSQDFSFSNAYYKVEFAESCAYHIDGEIQLDQVKKWIRKVSG